MQDQPHFGVVSRLADSFLLVTQGPHLWTRAIEKGERDTTFLTVDPN